MPKKLSESLPDELKQVINEWSNLPEHIKQAIMALVKTQAKT
jgi:hypothetical protein